MLDLTFWRRFHTRTDLNRKSLKMVVTDKFTYNISEMDNRHVNGVMYISDGDLDDIFEEINEVFKEKINGYEVNVRETDNPDLPTYLTDKGFKKSVVSEYRALELNKLVIGDMSEKINQNYRMEEKTREEMNSEDIYLLLKSCFPDEMKTREDFDTVNDAMYGMAEAGGFLLRNYILYDGDKPIAYGSLFDMGKFEDIHLGMLSGACTHPEYRKKGLYTTMLHLRLNHAKELGVDVMTIQADRQTSGPIVAKYGFDLIEIMTQYVPQDND